MTRHPRTLYDNIPQMLLLKSQCTHPTNQIHLSRVCLVQHTLLIEIVKYLILGGLLDKLGSQRSNLGRVFELHTVWQVRAVTIGGVGEWCGRSRTPNDSSRGQLRTRCEAANTLRGCEHFARLPSEGAGEGT